jgi:hypothetical protein
MLDMCCLVLAGPRERLSWRLNLFPAGNKRQLLVEVMSRLIALRCVQTKRDTSRLTLGVDRTYRHDSLWNSKGDRDPEQSASNQPTDIPS